MQREIQFEQSGASREGLTLQSIRNFKIVGPPLPEQIAIVTYLDKATANIEIAIERERVERERVQIDLLHEYRIRLIADVVTGKLDVREAAARLPDDVEEPQPRGEDEEWSEPVDDDIERSEALH